MTSLPRPGGNLTGINFLTSELVAKRLELLREMVPAATRVAVLVNLAARSMRPSLLSCASGPTPYSSVPTLSSAASGIAR